MRPTGRITFDREEVYWINRGRHPSYIEVKLDADEDGRVAGLDVDALIDGGAFASFGHVTSYYNGVLATAPYELGSFHYTGARVWTNKPASGAMRGHGAVNTRCAVEVGWTTSPSNCPWTLSTCVWPTSCRRTAGPSLDSASPATGCARPCVA